MFYVEYRDNKGIENLWTYNTQTLGDSAVGYVNDFSGHLVYQFDFKLNQGNFPYSPFYFYNTYLSGVEFKDYQPSITPYISSKYGYGWKLNLVETLRPISSQVPECYLDSKYKYVYNDQDGTDHYFVETVDEYNNPIIADEDDLGYTIQVNSDYYILKDNSGIEKRFSKTTGQILYLEYNDILFAYQYYNGNLVGISKGADTVYYFSYTSNYLTSLQDNFGNTANVQYSSGYASNFTNSTGGAYTFTYNTATTKTLKNVKENISNKNYSYSYISESSSKWNRVSRISSYKMITEYQGVSGQRVDISYGGNKTTTYRFAGLDDSIDTSDDILYTYNFDNYGKTINIYTSNVGKTIIYDSTMVSYGINTETFVLGENNVQTVATGGQGKPNQLLDSSAEAFNLWTSYTYGTIVNGAT